MPTPASALPAATLRRHHDQDAPLPAHDATAGSVVMPRMRSLIAPTLMDQYHHPV